MAPGESIRGQIHLELPKATPVHSIEVCLTGTVTALDGTRLGPMKTVTILEECKTVATASVTNTRTNTTRRHATSSSGAAAAAAATTTAAGSVTTVAPSEETPSRGRRRRSTVTSVQDRPRSPAIPIQNTIAAAVAATMAAQRDNNNSSRRLSAESMSRTLSMPSPYYASGLNTSTLSLNRSMSPTPADMRGRRTSFSANVDTPISGLGGIPGRTGRNMSMVNISTLSQFSMGGEAAVDDPSLPAAPSYDPPNYEGLFTSTANERPSGESTGTNATSSLQSESSTPQESGDPGVTIADEALPPTPSSSNSSEDVDAHSRRSSRESRNDQQASSTTPLTTAETTATPAPTEPIEPKAVLMQPGNYVIPFSIRIPSNTVMSLPGSFSDAVGHISYQLKAVMKQIVPSPDPYDPKAILVEPTFTSTTQVIKLIPMNDPASMPLYSVPFETESVRANVGHWVWTTGFMEAHVWIPKQGYRPGRIVPLVIHIVNHSDAKQVIVETTLCRCLHYGSGLSKIRAMGIAGWGDVMDPTLESLSASPTELAQDGMLTITQSSGRSSGGRHPAEQMSYNSNRSNRDSTMPSPPASPYGSNFPSTPTSERGGESPEGSVHGARMTSPNSVVSISSQWGSIHSNSSDGINTPLNSGPISYNPESRSAMTSPLPSATITSSFSTASKSSQQPLPIVQHQREKMSKSKTLINCNMAVDREIQRTIPVLIPLTAGYSILNAPLLEVSYEIVVKIRADKVRSRGIRLSVPIVVVVPEEGDLEEEEEVLENAGLASPAMMARDLGLAVEGDEYDVGDRGCEPSNMPGPRGWFLSLDYQLVLMPTDAAANVPRSIGNYMK
ncbi:hypothetical protein BGZ98_003771 [Dissophora globulifera]|nr:hypothetical protein BGZ98_003771 [Dissophora globulifera]